MLDGSFVLSLPEKLQYYVNVTENIWNIKEESINDIVTLINLGINIHNFQQNDIISMINKIASHRLHMLKIFAQLCKKIFEDLKLSRDITFSCYELRSILINNGTLHGSIVDGLANKSEEELYELYPKNSITHALFWDNLDELRELSSGVDFDFNSMVSFEKLIDMAAKYGAVHCFKYLYVNKARLSVHTLEKAFIGNNFEIINLCEQLYPATKNCLLNCVRWHRNESLFYILSKYEFNFSYSECLESYNLFCFFQKFCEVNDVEYVDLKGSTALHAAVDLGFVPIIDYILEKKPNLNRILPKQNPLVIMCIYNYRLDILKKLLDTGADPNISSHHDLSLLMLACSVNSFEAVELILKYNPDLNMKNSINQTALMFAVIAKNEQIVDLLLGKGAYTAVVDDRGNDAMAYALQSEFKPIIKRLKHATADQNET